MLGAPQGNGEVRAMTSSGKNPVREFFSAVAGDAFLFSAALFALAMAAGGAIMSLRGLFGPDGPVGVLGLVVSGTSSLLGLAAVVAGAVIAWKLHGHDFGGAAIPGIVLGIVLAAITMGVGFFALAGIGTGISALSGSEFAGLIFLVVAAVVGTLVIVVRLDVDAVRDMAPARSEHRRLDTLRLVATAVLVVYSVGVAVAVYLNPGSEVGEAILFAIMAGAQAGLVTAFADMWVRRDERKQTDTTAAISA
jgi:hypothetical protein